MKCLYQSRPFLQNLEEHTLLCIAYGEGVVLIIDVVRANEFLQDEIGIGTSPDPSVRSKGWNARLVFGLIHNSLFLSSTRMLTKSASELRTDALVRLIPQRRMLILRGTGS